MIQVPVFGRVSNSEIRKLVMTVVGSLIAAYVLARVL